MYFIFYKTIYNSFVGLRVIRICMPPHSLKVTRSRKYMTRCLSFGGAEESYVQEWKQYIYDRFI